MIKEMNHIIEKARKHALSEIEKYGLPPLFLFNSAFEVGQELAEKLDVDKEFEEGLKTIPLL